MDMGKERIVCDEDPHILLTGEERYPLIGGSDYTDSHTRPLQIGLKGLPRYGGCLEKAKIAQREFGGVIIMGRLAIYSAINGGLYRFDYNPPTEFHAWLQFVPGWILDLSLPGVIERGMKMTDELGPIIEGRVPAILFGKPPAWAIYEAVIQIRS